MGATGVLTRTVLEALREPGTVASLMGELGLLRADAWAMIKHLHEQGRLERLSSGVYRITPLGETALAERVCPAPARIGRGVRQPPAGKGRTPERAAWLERHYGKLGYRRSAELLRMQPANVWRWAADMGLKFGEVEGYILLTDLSRLLELDYAAVYSRAKRAGILTFPESTLGKLRRRKAMVPEAWADQISSERQPPAPEDVSLADVQERCGISKTQAARRAGRAAYLRTPPRGGQPRLFVSKEVADQIIRRYQERGRRPADQVVGRAGVLAAVTAAGAEGASERELYAPLPCSRAAVRVHVHAMWLAGELERCRLGDTLDPFVYRLVEHASAPKPLKRIVVIPGRRATPLADLGVTDEVARSVRDAMPRPVPGAQRARHPRGSIKALAERYGIDKAVVYRILAAPGTEAAD